MDENGKKKKKEVKNETNNENTAKTFTYSETGTKPEETASAKLFYELWDKEQNQKEIELRSDNNLNGYLSHLDNIYKN